MMFYNLPAIILQVNYSFLPAYKAFYMNVERENYF